MPKFIEGHIDYAKNHELSPDYPKNLLCAVFKYDNSSYPKIIPDDILESIDIALDTLTDREKDLIIMRYKYSWTDEEIIEEFVDHCTDPNDRIEKAIRRLRHPSRAKYLAKGARNIAKERYLESGEIEDSMDILPESMREALAESASKAGRKNRLLKLIAMIAGGAIPESALDEMAAIAERSIS